MSTPKDDRLAKLERVAEAARKRVTHHVGCDECDGPLNAALRALDAPTFEATRFNVCMNGQAPVLAVVNRGETLCTAWARLVADLLNAHVADGGAVPE